LKSASSPSKPVYNRGHHFFALILAGLVFFLIVAGALVTSNNAGLAVPDWPTSFGSLYRIPPMVGGVKYEHGHRMLAEFVGLLTIVMCVWTFRVDSRSWMRKLSLAALGTVILQGILGGITVLTFLPWYVSSSHAALGQTFFSISVLMALFTSRQWLEGVPVISDDANTPSTRTLTLLVVAVLYLQLFFGAGFRHSGIGILSHLVNAIFTSAVLLWVSIRVLVGYGKSHELRRPAVWILGLLLLQLGLGFAAYLTRVIFGPDAPQPLPSMVYSTAAHVAVGALLLATAFILVAQTHRRNASRTILETEAANIRKAVTA
jgi:cytochrome c oxidase assembly protein subunit 15